MENKTFSKYLNPTAVITGASSGIGFELAKVFASNGFNLIICAEDPYIIEASSKLNKFGVSVEAVQADLRTYEGVHKLVDKIQSLGQPIDTIAINAGVGVSGEFVDTDLQAEIDLIQLNVISVVHLTKHVLKDMKRNGYGRILFTSSVAADAPGPYLAVYSASKAFVQSFVEAIRYEVKDVEGITITSMQPGATDTNFFKRADMMTTKAGVSEKDDPAVVAKEGFDALMDGKDHVVTGSIKNKVNTVMNKFMPETFGAAASAKELKPGSAYH